MRKRQEIERESLLGPRSSGYSVRTYEKPCVDFHWHFHPEWELVYIHEGNGIRHIGTSVRPYGKGEFCLIGENLPHAFSSKPIERSGAKWTVLHFLPQMWGEVFWKLPQNRTIVALFAEAAQGVTFSGPEVSKCSELLLSLEKKRSFTMPLLLELLERLSRISRSTILKPDVPTDDYQEKIDPRLQKVLAWIDEKFRRGEVTQEAASRLAAMSPQAFSRFFRSHLGRTFQRYVNEVRVADACATLNDPERTISEAAFSAGFNNIANFNRRFREILGRTPTSYRQ